MTVHGVHHQLMNLYVFIVPQAAVGQWRVIGAWVNGAIAGVDDTPTAFGTDFTHGGTCMRHLLTGPERVRRAIKSIRCGYRTDLDGLEENVVAGISTHAILISVVVLVCRIRTANVAFHFGPDREVSTWAMEDVFADRLAVVMPAQHTRHVQLWKSFVWVKIRIFH